MNGHQTLIMLIVTHCHIENYNYFQVIDLLEAFLEQKNGDRTRKEKIHIFGGLVADNICITRDTPSAKTTPGRE